MAVNRLLELVQRNAVRLAQEWKDEVKRTENMRCYHRLSDEELVRRNVRVFENLACWLDVGATRNQIGSYFVDVGKKRYHEGFPLCEVTYALNVDKKVLWNLLRAEGFLDTPVQMNQAMEMLHTIHGFFDLGTFYLTRGYMEALYSRLVSTGRFTMDEMKGIFFAGSFFKDEIYFH